MKKNIIAAALGFSLIALPAAQAEDAKVHRYAANHLAWSTNSYWIEGPDGVALIDAQLVPSDAKLLAAQIKATGKPLKGVIITHPHLDHFGGLPTLKDELGDFPVYASQVTADNFASVHKQILGYYPMPNAFGEALDERLGTVTDIVSDGQELSIAGLMFKIHLLGAGEAADNAVIYQKDINVVFAGDTYYPHTHYYVGEGHLDGAIGHLTFLKNTYPADTFVLPGHNDVSRLTSADEQIAYIETVQKLTEEAMAKPENVGENGYLTQTARRGVVDSLLEKYRSYDDFGFNPRQLVAGNVFGAEKEILTKKKGM